MRMSDALVCHCRCLEVCWVTENCETGEHVKERGVEIHPTDSACRAIWTSRTETKHVLERGKLVLMSKRAIESGTDTMWLKNIVWENSEGGVVLLIPQEVPVWRGFVMSECAERRRAEGAVNLFAELYFSGTLGLSESWSAAEALCYPE
jgi:hypothetical protein